MLSSHRGSAATTLFINSFIAASSHPRIKLLTSNAATSRKVLPILLLLLPLWLMMLQETTFFRRDIRGALIADSTRPRLLLLMSVVLVMCFRRMIHNSLSADSSLSRLLRGYRCKRLHRRDVRSSRLLRAAWPLAIEGLIDNFLRLMRATAPWSLRGKWLGLHVLTGMKRPENV